MNNSYKCRNQLASYWYVMRKNLSYKVREYFLLNVTYMCKNHASHTSDRKVAVFYEKDRLPHPKVLRGFLFSLEHVLCLSSWTGFKRKFKFDHMTTQSSRICSARDNNLLSVSHTLCVRVEVSASPIGSWGYQAVKNCRIHISGGLANLVSRTGSSFSTHMC